MKKAMTVLAVLSCALAAVAADAKDPKKDPRRNYSSDGWKLEWSDEFDGKGAMPDAANWKPEVGFLRNQEPQYYTSNRVENCCVKDGVLTITARKEKWPNPLYKDRHLGGYGNKVVDEDTKDEKSGKVTPAAKFPMEMKIDWVRYYRR